MEKQIEEATKASVDKVSGMIPPGADEDGKAFVEECAKEVQGSLWLFATMFNSFVDEFDGVFLGPVGDRTVADLLEPKEGEAAGNRIKGLHVERHLKDLYDQARDWDLDFDGISDHHREYIDKMIRKELDRLAPKIKHTGDLTIADANTIAIKLFKKDKTNEMKRLPGWSD